MAKLGRESNLIRYSSQARDRGESPGLLRARTLIYPLLLLGIATAFVVILSGKSNFDASLMREPGMPFVLTEDEQVRNMLKLKLTNRTDKPMSFDLDVLTPSKAIASVGEDQLALEPQQAFTFHVSVLADRSNFMGGKSQLQLKVTNQDGQTQTMSLKLRGPF